MKMFYLIHSINGWTRSWIWTIWSVQIIIPKMNIEPKNLMFFILESPSSRWSIFKFQPLIFGVVPKFQILQPLMVQWKMLPSQYFPFVRGLVFHWTNHGRKGGTSNQPTVHQPTTKSPTTNPPGPSSSWKRRPVWRSRIASALEMRSTFAWSGDGQWWNGDVLP